MIPGPYLHGDKIVSPPPSVYGFDLYFCFIDLMIHFTDTNISHFLYGLGP